MGTFQDMLKEQQDRINNSGGFDNDEPVVYPNSQLKNEELRFDKDNDQHVVRILPPKNPEDYFAKKFKEVFLTVHSKNDKAMNLNAVIGMNDTPETSKLLANYNTWKQQKRVPNRFNKEAPLSVRYFVNAVRVVQDQNGQPTMERDQNGEMIVRLLKLPSSAHDALVSKMLDPYLQPSGETEYGIIGTNNAYALSFRKPPKGSGQMTYSVDVYQRDLGPLPNNWRDLLEDLDYQATPSEQYNGKYVSDVIDIANGIDPNANRGNQQGDTQGQAPQPGIPNQQPYVPQQTQGQPQQQFNPEPQWSTANTQQQQPVPQQQNTQPYNNQQTQAPQQQTYQPQAQPQDQGQPDFANQLPPQNYQGDVSDNLPSAMDNGPSGNQQPAPQQTYQPPVQESNPVQQPQAQAQPQGNNAPQQQTPSPTTDAGAPDIASFLQQMTQQQN